MFHPLLQALSLSSLMSPNSSSRTIPTTEAVAIQPTSDGAEERAIVPAGLTLALIYWLESRAGKITGIDYRTGWRCWAGRLEG